MCKSGSGGEKGESVSGSTEKPKKMWKGGEGDEMSGVTLSMYYSRVSGEPKRGAGRNAISSLASLLLFSVHTTCFVSIAASVSCLRVSTSRVRIVP